MKTRLLCMLLFISSITFSQNWTQVGAAQFTDFSNNAEIAFHPVTGNPYIVTSNPANNEIKVKAYNGTNWSDVSPVLSTVGHNNMDIKFNPVNNDLWVVLKRNGSGTSSTLDVYKYNGATWTAEATNFLSGGGFYSHGVQIQFSSTGTPRIAATVSGGSGRLKVVLLDYQGTNNWTVTNDVNELNLRKDFTGYNEYFWTRHRVRFASFEGTINKRTLNPVNNSFNKAFYPSKTLQVSGIKGTNYAVSNDVVGFNTRINPTPYPDIIFTNGANSNVPQPLNTRYNTNNILKFRKSRNNNNFYLMFSANDQSLVFQKFNGSTWSYVPSVGIQTSAAGFFVDMEMNPVDGNMYIVYLDGGKASVKKFSVAPPLNKYYVNANASGGNGSGDSWANAMPSLQAALNAAGSNTTEIWIAAGTYKPGTARSSSFKIVIDNLKLYGGFSGTETTINQRDISSNPTILSGDLNGNDNANVTYNNTTRGDNSLRIVSIRGNNILLDGFTISSGHANAGSGEGRFSAGLKTEDNVQNFTIKNCIIKDNVAWWSAGLGLYSNVNNSNMTIDACVFENNLSSSSTSFYAIPRANRTMNVSVTNCLFKNNTTRDNGTGRKASGSSGGWIRAYYNGSTINATVVNNTFVNNTNGGTNGGDYPTLGLSYNNGGGNLGTLTIANNIFWGNKRNGNTALAIGGVTNTLKAGTIVVNSIDEGSFSNITYLTNTSNANPLFTSATDFTVQTGSPAINSGDNLKIPSGIVADLAGNNRIHNTTVDMGAYEFGASPIVYRTLNITAANGSVTTNPTGTSFIDGASVTLTATPDSGYRFDNWSGDATGATNPLTIVMNADKSITANFSLIPAPTPSFANLPSNATGAFTATINFDTAVTGFVMSDIQVSGATLSNFNAVSATQYTVLVTPTNVCNTSSITLEVPANVATDSNNSSLNNLTSGVQTINVTDNAVPVATAQNITVQLDTNGQVTITPQQINNGSSDNCSIASMSLDKTSFTCADLGANQVVLTVVDSSSNSNTATATVTVEDSIAPTAVAQNLSVQLGTNGQVSVTPAQINDGSTDNCTSIANLTYSLSKTNFTCNDLGANNVTLTVADASGNQATATAVVTVSQNPNAQLAAVTQDITVQLDANGQATITPQQINNGSGSGCNSNPTLSLDKTMFDCSNVGANTVTLTATDNGNSVSATATVTVQDTMQPNTIAQNITVQLDANGQATISTTDIDNGSSDNCSIASMSLDTTSFTCANTGANQVVLTVVDANGNSNTATATVTVEDSIAPTAVAQNLSVQLGTNGQVSVTPAQINNGSTDNCTSAANLTYSLSQTNFTCNDLGANNVTLTVADANGNQATAAAVVTVSQNPNAQLAAVTQNITVQLDASGNATITPEQINNGSGSGCNSNPALSLDKTTFDCSNVGANTVTLTVTDGGNSVTGTAVVTVQDTTKPTIIAQDITVQLDANGQATISTTDINNGSSDNCSIASMSLDKTTFDCSNVGTNQVVLTVVDANGNSNTATATVTVEDAIAPTAVAQNISVQLGANNQVTITPSQINNGSSDNCTSATNLMYSLSQTNFTCSDVGQKTVTLTVTDASGNSATANAVVTVTANPSAPLAAVAQNITVQLDANGSVTITPQQINNGSGSGCNSNPTLSLDKTTFDCSNIGANTVTLTVTDGGVTETATAIVTVEDTMMPTVVTKDITVTLNNGQGTIAVSDIDDNSTDNCSVASTSLDKTSFTCSDLGANTVTLTVTDGQGNVATKTAVVTVVETVAPTVITQNITVALDANGAATITPQQIDNGSSDACSGIAIMSLDTTSFQCPDLSTPQTVTLTVTDNSGNSATGTAIVTFTALDEDNDGISDACDSKEVVFNKGFSPNGDGLNDTWVIENIDNYPKNTVEIFNRWGEKVYQVSNYQNNWDGKANQKGGSSEKLPAGQYLYIIKLNEPDTKPIQGWLYINY